MFSKVLFYSFSQQTKQKLNFQGRENHYLQKEMINTLFSSPTKAREIETYIP